MKPLNTLIFILGIIACISCSTDNNSFMEQNNNPLAQTQYFGNLEDLAHNQALNGMDNEHAESLRIRLYNLRAYMSENKERLKIQDWHNEDTYLLSESDTPAEPSGGLGFGHHIDGPKRLRPEHRTSDRRAQPRDGREHLRGDVSLLSETQT